MKHVFALFVKVVTLGILVAVTLGVVGRVNVLGIYASIAGITILGYLLGDLLILPRFGNAVATISDGFIAAATVWALQFVVSGMNVTPGAIWLTALAVAVAEIFFHRFVTLTVLATTPGDIEDDG